MLIDGINIYYKNGGGANSNFAIENENLIIDFPQ